MTRREINARDRSWLVAELSSWVAQGLVSGDQAARIIDVYQTTDELGRRRSDRGIQILSGLAALLVGLAVLLLVGFNWDALPDPLKLAAACGAIAATHSAGCFARYRLRRPGESEVLFFIACMFFGSGIWLVAQVFNLSSNNYDGLWWWALGALPFALLLNGALLHVLVVSLLGLYQGFSVFGSLNAGSFLFNHWWMSGEGYFSVPALAVVGLLWAYRKQSARVVGLYVPLVCWWLVLQPFAWGLREPPVYLIGCVGCFLLVLAECHREESPMAIPYRLYGAILAAGALVPLTYLGFHSTIGDAGLSVGVLVETTLVLVATVVAAVLAAEARRRSSLQPMARTQSLFAEDRRVIPPALLAMAIAAVAYWELLVGEPVIPTVLANIAMLALAFWLIMLGLRQDRGRPFAAGVFYFLLWTVLRYIDLFGGSGMLGAAAMFFFCGAALFGVARYWQYRRSGVVSHAGA